MLLHAVLRNLALILRFLFQTTVGANVNVDKLDAITFLQCIQIPFLDTLTQMKPNGLVLNAQLHKIIGFGAITRRNKVEIFGTINNGSRCVENVRMVSIT